MEESEKTTLSIIPTLCSIVLEMSFLGSYYHGLLQHVLPKGEMIGIISFMSSIGLHEMNGQYRILLQGYPYLGRRFLSLMFGACNSSVSIFNSKCYAK